MNRWSRQALLRHLALLFALLVAGLSSCEPRGFFSPQEVYAARLGTLLPRGFLLGVGTSAYQVEGGLTNNDWYQWEQGHNPDTGRPNTASPCGRACDSWNRWQEDQQMLGTLGATAYRLSIEWSRVEPARGQWDTAALAAYRTQLLALRARHIQPVVTVYHNTLPLWVSSQGGWEWAGIYDALAEFTARLGREYGDLVDTWITINEANAVVAAGYLSGMWPPGVRDNARAWRVFVNLLRGHARITAALRASDLVDADGDGRATFIGMAHHIVVFQAGTGSALDAALAATADDVFNEMIPRAVRTGRVTFAPPGNAPIDEPMPELVGTFDYFGLQYYRRELVRADLFSSNLWVNYHPSGRPLSDDELEIYPEGLYQSILHYAAYGWPIIITENGLADVNDTQREWYLRSHLYAIARATQAGADVRAYLHWALMDNFEWAGAYQFRYGFYNVDFSNPLLPRTPRPSAAVFRSIADELAASSMGH